MLPNLQVWLAHFEYHAERRRHAPASIADRLTPEECRSIARSVATFQLGERSEGRTLLRAARRYEQLHDAAPLTRIMELFIEEEKHHAALLNAFMSEHGIPVRQHDWTDRVFRCARRLAGFELHIAVLVTAELIANVYYRALEAATDCRRLKGLCHIMVSEELAHVAFESELLLAWRATRPAPVRLGIKLAHRAFLVGTSLVVWATHRRVLRRAGYRLSTFAAACLNQYAFYLGSPRDPSTIPA